MEDGKKRMIDAVDDAEMAFWAEIVKHFPEIETGDLPPDIVIPLRIQNEDAVCHWLGGNSDLFPSFRDDYDKEHYCGECGEKMAPAGVKLCGDCCREKNNIEMGAD
jgi:hypothetical protein